MAMCNIVVPYLVQSGPPCPDAGPGLGGRESAMPMVDIEPEEPSISSLHISSQSLPNADAAASVVMQVETIDCRTYRPTAQGPYNKAYCRSWRRAAWSAASAKLKAHLQCEKVFSLTVVMSGLLDHKHGRSVCDANLRAAGATLKYIDRQAVLVVHDPSTFEFVKSDRGQGAHRFSLLTETEHFQADANAALRSYVQSADRSINALELPPRTHATLCCYSVTQRIVVVTLRGGKCCPDDESTRSAHVMRMRDGIVKWHEGKNLIHQLSVVVTWLSDSRYPTCCHSCTDGWCRAATDSLLHATIGPMYKIKDSMAYYVDELNIGRRRDIPKPMTPQEQLTHLLETVWRIDVTLVKGAAGFPKTAVELSRAYEDMVFGLPHLPRAMALKLISSSPPSPPTVCDHLRRSCPMGSAALVQQFLDKARELRIRWPGKEYSNQWIFSASVVDEIFQARGEDGLVRTDLPADEQDVVSSRPLICPEAMHSASIDETVTTANEEAQRHKSKGKLDATIALARKQYNVIASLNRAQVCRGFVPSSHADIFGEASCRSASAAP